MDGGERYKFRMERGKVRRGEKYDRQGLKKALESHLSQLQNEPANLQNKIFREVVQLVINRLSRM